MTDPGSRRGLLPLLLLSLVVVLVTVGLARGLWPSNLHNAVLALAFTAVGAYVLRQRPGHREGLLFLATGLVEAVLFFGRQVGLAPGWPADRWWGWLGVWPVALGLALTTLSVIGFPDGRLPSPRWRPVVVTVVVVGVVCAGLSALWPVEYAATGVVTRHPLDVPGAGWAGAVWGAVAHPAYVGFQLLWVLAIVLRWRGAGRLVRVQLTWVALAAGLSVVLLLVGLAVWGTPRLGVLAAGLVPVAAGWAIVHGQQLAAYSALSWLSRTGGAAQDLPTELVRAVGESLSARRAVLWLGDEAELHPVGVWPDDGADIGPGDLSSLPDGPGRLVRPVVRRDEVVGALSVDRLGADRLSSAETKLLDDLTAQAGLVIEHLTLAREAARQRGTGDVTRLSPRERDVLALMARGLSNAAIGRELHLSIKTVEPVVSAIFTKLGLAADAGSNRRVLAVLTYLRT